MSTSLPRQVPTRRGTNHQTATHAVSQWQGEFSFWCKRISGTQWRLNSVLYGIYLRRSLSAAVFLHILSAENRAWGNTHSTSLDACPRPAFRAGLRARRNMCFLIVRVTLTQRVKWITWVSAVTSTYRKRGCKTAQCFSNVRCVRNLSHECLQLPALGINS